MLRTAMTCAFLGLAGITACATPAPDPGALALRHAEAGQLDEAVAEIERAVHESPDDSQLRRQAAAIHAQAGDVARAIEHLESAIQVSPGDAGLWLDLADLERGRDNIEDAYLAYRRASELAPDSIPAVSGLALAADSLGFDAEADDAYARWTELERLELGNPPY